MISHFHVHAFSEGRNESRTGDAEQHKSLRVCQKRRKIGGIGCFFQLSWVCDFKYIRTRSKARNKPYCIACNVHFGIALSVKNDVKRHIEHDSHRTKVSALSRIGGGIARYVAAGTEVDRVTAPETMFLTLLPRATCHWGYRTILARRLGK